MTEASPHAAAALSRPDGAGPSAGEAAPPGVYSATTAYTPPHWNAPSPADHGVRAATLLGVGGALGWTAAAAYQWLNGGDFSWLPSSSSETGRHDEETSNDARTTRRFPSHALADAAADAREDAGDHPAAGTDALTAQVQSLVEALQTQSREQREILQTLVYHKDRQQTDASMRRLRQSSSTASSAEDPQAANLSQLLVFGKLAEVTAELSSLRRDVATLPDATTVDTIAWEARLGATLTQVEECVACWQETAAAATTTTTEDAAVLTADTGKSTRVATPVSSVDATPVRTKIPWSSADDTAALSSSHTPDSPPTRDTVEEALTVLVLQNEAAPLRVGAQLLYLYAVNLSMHSSIPRYRKIFTSNESFQKVDALTGGRALLRAVGFIDEDNSLVWQPATGGADDETEALVVLGEVAVALGVLKSSSSPSSKEEERAREDLLAQALACLSVQSAQASLAPTTTTATTTATTTPGSHTTNSLLLARHGSSALSDRWRTPDPSIVSPPATKKQGGSLPPPPENEDDAVVQFSPPRLLQGGSRSVVVQENVDDSHGTPPTDLDAHDVLDVDSVWK